MQISRHWRNQQQRYRLEGVRLQNGEVSLLNRPTGHGGAERTEDVGGGGSENHQTSIPLEPVISAALVREVK